MSVSLTARDLELLELLADEGAMTLEAAARRFFSRDPFTGRLNRDPMKACERRVSALCRDGYVIRAALGPKSALSGVLLRPGARAARSRTEAAPRAPRGPSRTAGHLAATLEAIARVKARLTARGAAVVAVTLEDELRRAAQAGRFMRRGDRFEPFADAVIVAEVRRADGTTRRVRVALEYVTSKYTDKDIEKKHASFSAPALYDEALWFCDRPSTKARVERITGHTCTAL